MLFAQFWKVKNGRLGAKKTVLGDKGQRVFADENSGFILRKIFPGRNKGLKAPK